MMKKKQPSLFFPLALIAAGVLWILISMGKIPSENLWALAHFWPLLLIAAGIGLILRSYWSWSRMVIDVLIVGGAVAAIIFAPQLGWTTPQLWGMGMGGVNFVGATPGSGNVVSQTREVSGFTSVSIRYPAEVVIQQGSSESVKLEADDNLLPQLTTEVSDGELTITNDVSSWAERVNPTRPVHIMITVKDLGELSFSSAGRVEIDNLETDSLKVRLSGAGELDIVKLAAGSFDCSMSGAGSMTASGEVDTLTLNVSGVGSFRGEDLSSVSAEVRLSGVGSVTVRAKETLTAQVSGLGSVRYYGNPQITQRVSGLGSVNKIGE